MRDALGAALPVGVPETFTEPVPDPLGDLVLRYARTHGPFPAAECATRFGLGVAVVAGMLDRMVGAGRLVRGELRPLGHGDLGYGDPGGDRVDRDRTGSSTATPRCCAGCAGRRWPGCGPRWSRSSRARWAGSCRPGRACRSAADGGRRGRMRRAPGAEDVLGVVEQLAGAPLPASALESLILPARLPGYTPALLDELTAAGEVTWTGCGPLAGVDGWLALAPGRRGRPAAARPGAGRGRHPAAPGRAGRAGPARAGRGRRSAGARCSSASSPTGPAARCSTPGSRRRRTPTWSPPSGIWSGPGC